VIPAGKLCCQVAFVRQPEGYIEIEVDETSLADKTAKCPPSNEVKALLDSTSVSSTNARISFYTSYTEA
jgi:hypothetical protein